MNFKTKTLGKFRLCSISRLQWINYIGGVLQCVLNVSTKTDPRKVADYHRKSINYHEINNEIVNKN